MGGKPGRQPVVTNLIVGRWVGQQHGSVPIREGGRVRECPLRRGEHKELNGRVGLKELVIPQDYVRLAEAMLAISRKGLGKTREELHGSVKALFYGKKCDGKRVEAFCKLLDDESEFDGRKGDAAGH